MNLLQEQRNASSVSALCLCACCALHRLYITAATLPPILTSSSRRPSSPFFPAPNTSPTVFPFFKGGGDIDTEDGRTGGGILLEIPDNFLAAASVLDVLDRSRDGGGGDPGGGGGGSGDGGGGGDGGDGGDGGTVEGGEREGAARAARAAQQEVSGATLEALAALVQQTAIRQGLVPGGDVGGGGGEVSGEKAEEVGDNVEQEGEFTATADGADDLDASFVFP